MPPFSLCTTHVALQRRGAGRPPVPAAPPASPVPGAVQRGRGRCAGGAGKAREPETLCCYHGTACTGGILVLYVCTSGSCSGSWSRGSSSAGQRCTQPTCFKHSARLLLHAAGPGTAGAAAGLHRCERPRPAAAQQPRAGERPGWVWSARLHVRCACGMLQHHMRPPSPGLCTQSTRCPLSQPSAAAPAQRGELRCGRPGARGAAQPDRTPEPGHQVGCFILCFKLPVCVQPNTVLDLARLSCRVWVSGDSSCQVSGQHRLWPVGWKPRPRHRAEQQVRFTASRQVAARAGPPLGH